MLNQMPESMHDVLSSAFVVQYIREGNRISVPIIMGAMSVVYESPSGLVIVKEAGAFHGHGRRRWYVKACYRIVRLRQIEPGDQIMGQHATYGNLVMQIVRQVRPATSKVLDVLKREVDATA